MTTLTPESRAPEQSAAEETRWLKSPVSARVEQLRPMQELEIDPYRGPRRKVKLVRTHYLIGSGEDCDIRVSDPYVSPNHAELQHLSGGQGFLVRDLNSRNGIFLNGVRVREAPLPGQGLLRVGRSTISWALPKDAAAVDDECIAADPAMKEALAGLKRVAKSALPVLLLGETGTGKDVFARLLHRWSQRDRGPYIPVNGALTGGNLAESELFGHKKGAFTGAETARLGALRAAHGGSLFLDEVADIPGAAQVKLLRALESGEVRPLGSDVPERTDFRLITATSQNIDARVEEGSFRMDLYFRIAGHVVLVPPLRERPLDILTMARHWLNAHELLLDESAEARLLSYRWPGNVRELKACVERARVSALAENATRVLPRHLGGLNRSAPVPERLKKGCTLEEVEKEYILASLERNGWSRLATSQELGIARSTLFEKMKRYALRDRALV